MPHSSSTVAVAVNVVAVAVAAAAAAASSSFMSHRQVTTQHTHTRATPKLSTAPYTGGTRRILAMVICLKQNTSE